VNTFTGRQTGLLATDSLNFTGKSIVGVTDANGNLTQRLTIDFGSGSGSGTITAEPPGSGPYAFTNSIGSFTTALNSALAGGTPPGAASFTKGVLSLNAGTGGGLVVQQDPTTPSARAGRGFSQFFGLNDLVSRPTPLFFENGIKGTDVHGFNSGGSLTYQVTDASGRFIATRTVAITGTLAAAGSTWNDLLGALNATGTGLGEFGSFAMDPNTGQMKFTASPGFNVQLVSDSTTRGQTGVSLTSLEGMSAQATAGRAVEVGVDPEIAADPSRLAVGRPDLTAALGSKVIEQGDNRGSAALSAAKDTIQQFAAAGSLGAQSTSITLYASRLGGEAGRMASDAQRDADGAQAVATAASDRRSQVEGVSLDDELLKMTTYQNAYAASARVIQAATEMFDVLLNIGITTPV
jgi:flagellar hook-associated protein 1 FlgK